MMGGFGGIGMVLWIGVIVAAIWWIVQTATNQRAPDHRADALKAPRELLYERLARGEITVEQYRELKKALE
jgi:uncharacterized membrane protein